MVSALDSTELSDYRSFENALFNAMRGLLDHRQCRADLTERLHGSARNKLGYLLTTLSLPIPFSVDDEAPVTALFWKDEEAIVQPARLDKVAAHWRLSKGLNMTRWQQFLRTGAC
jgi:hypothetical protein